MKLKFKRNAPCTRALLLLCSFLLLPGLTSCADAHAWLWSRDEHQPPAVDSSLFYVQTEPESQSPSTPDADAPRYEFDGTQTHVGTGIHYEAPEGSPNGHLCVVIDAGHQKNANSQKEAIGPGASETAPKVAPGKTGTFTGQREYELNLAVALRLRNELAARGYGVFMIRETNDVNISERERAELANGIASEYEDTIYIRIHAESADDGTTRGAMAICTSGASPYPCAAQYERSRLLSGMVLNSYCSATGVGKHTATPLAENDGEAGMNWSRVPTVTMVLGYLSHETEDRLMSYGDFRDEAAMGLANGITAYFRRIAGLGENELPAETIAVTEAEPTTPDAPNDSAAGESSSETGDALGNEIPPESTPDGGNSSEAEFATDETEAFDATATHPGVNIHYAAAADSPHAGQCVVIDAGHQLYGNSEQEPNGPDSDVMKNKVTGGATGQFTGQAEYALNLQVALYLRNELVARGYNVVMVRETNEVDISNAERARLANAYQAVYDEVILIRIHGNGASDSSASGALVMCQSSNNPYPDCAAQYDESRRLSLAVLDGYEAISGIPRRTNYLSVTDTMTGINWSTVPATILEMGFLSNEGDDRLMLTDEFRRAAAEGIADGVDSYFSKE